MNWKYPIWRIMDHFKGNSYKWYKWFKTTEKMNTYELNALQELLMLALPFNKKVKFTTKEDIRNYKPNLKGKKWTKHSSSGSTGKPLDIYGPDYLQYVKSAIFERAWEWVGWNRKDWIVRLTAGEPQWKCFDYFRNVHPHNYREINDKLIDWIVINEPFLIHGGSGAIREITTKLIQRKQEFVMKDIKLYLMSEDTKLHKEFLHKYWKDVFSGYGLAELCTVASECEFGNLHVNMETAKVETDNGEIIITDLINTITPLLRYRTGDYGKLAINQNCPCGIKHDILYDVQGRGVGYYDGPLTKKPLGWWILSPISHRYGKYIDSWKVVVDLKKNKYKFFVVWKDKSNKMIWYKRFIKMRSGLDLEIIPKKRINNKMRMQLLEIRE